MNEKLFAATKETFVKKDVYPGYPETRLVIEDPNLKIDSIELPDGPWVMNNTNLPSESESQVFRDAGYKTDSEGRPLHPWLKDMITDPDLGVVTGKGKYWNWGPNYTADPIVITREERPRVLLIQRSDTGKWALPGGFVDPGETDPIAAARRELFEEAGVQVEAPGELIYQDVVADLRTTAHAWAETSAYRFFVDEPLPVIAGDDAVNAEWRYIDELAEDLHGSHAVLIELALEQLKNPPKESIRNILNKPSEQLQTTIIDAGHMAYDHMFVSDGTTRLFVKAHDASRFTDAFREAHSRSYLEKEFALFTHLAELGYDAIPEQVDLVDDVLLAMSALHEDDGWMWRAPENEQFDAYVRSILTAFDTLQAQPIPEHPAFHDDINPTYETFWAEGWDDITDDKIEPLIAKITQLSVNWNESQQQDARELIKDLSVLRENAAHIERNVPLFMAHNDARQSNIAWNPEAGTRIIDWSWGDPAPKDADKTMFLIDLVKSGFDVGPYVEHVNRDYLNIYLGFLLAHSLWNTRDGSTTVREQQVASASAAHQLLTLLP